MRGTKNLVQPQRLFLSRSQTSVLCALVPSMQPHPFFSCAIGACIMVALRTPLPPVDATTGQTDRQTDDCDWRCCRQSCATPARACHTLSLSLSCSMGSHAVKRCRSSLKHVRPSGGDRLRNGTINCAHNATHSAHHKSPLPHVAHFPICLLRGTTRTETEHTQHTHTQRDRTGLTGE